MSSKRARYVGPFDEVIVQWPPGSTVDVQSWTVPHNHWLPDDAPAKLRDELLATEDWTEVEAATDKKKGGDS